jgi:hypothetical protein
MEQVRALLDLFQIPNGAILKLSSQPDASGQNREIWVSGIQTSHLVDLTALGNAD